MTAAPPVRLDIDRIRIEGAPGALRDTRAFSRVLDEALAAALAGVDPAAARTADLRAIKVRVPPGAGPQDIARAVAQTIARAVGGG